MLRAHASYVPCYHETTSGVLILNGFRSGPDSILDPEGLDIGEPIVQCHRIVEVSAPSLKDQTECSRKSKQRIWGWAYEAAPTSELGAP